MMLTYRVYNAVQVLSEAQNLKVEGLIKVEMGGVSDTKVSPLSIIYSPPIRSFKQFGIAGQHFLF